MNTNAIIDEVRMLAGPGPGQQARAWSLAWRAVRFLERAVETARRARMDSFNPNGPTPVGDSVKFIASRCLRAAIRQPVAGEAQVCVALENAVDTARAVAARLYDDYVAMAEKASEAVLRDPRRLARLRARRSVAFVRAERFLASTGGDA